MSVQFVLRLACAAWCCCWPPSLPPSLPILTPTTPPPLSLLSLGSGDITQRFLPAFVATENMKRGMSPQEACEDAVRRIMKKVDTFAIGIVCLNGKGEHSAAGHGWDFKYCSATAEENEPQCHPVIPLAA